MQRERDSFPPAWRSCQSHYLTGGGESGLERPAGSLGGSGIPRPPGLARPGGSFGERCTQTGLFQPGGTGKVWGPPPASGPSTVGEDGQALGRPTRAGLATGAPRGLTGPSLGGRRLRAAVPDILMLLHLGPHKEAERGRASCSAGSLSGGGRLRAWRPYPRAP